VVWIRDGVDYKEIMKVIAMISSVFLSLLFAEPATTTEQELAAFQANSLKAINALDYDAIESSLSGEFTHVIVKRYINGEKTFTQSREDYLIQTKYAFSRIKTYEHSFRLLESNIFPTPTEDGAIASTKGITDELVTDKMDKEFKSKTEITSYFIKEDDQLKLLKVVSKRLK